MHSFHARRRAHARARRRSGLITAILAIAIIVVDAHDGDRAGTIARKRRRVSQRCGFSWIKSTQDGFGFRERRRRGGAQSDD